MIVTEPTTLSEAKALIAKLTEYAFEDSLTCIPNRRAFDFHLEQQDKKTGLGLMILDIDHFKIFNDTFGHQAGDRLLTGICSLWQPVVKRQDDFIARYGGEEFAVITNGLSAKYLPHLAAAMHEATRASGKYTPNGQAVTISIGGAIAFPDENEPTGYDVHSLIAEADRNLYVAKNNGRNCSAFS